VSEVRLAADAALPSSAKAHARPPPRTRRDTGKIPAGLYAPRFRTERILELPALELRRVAAVTLHTAQKPI